MARKKKRDAEEAGFAGETSPQRVRLTPVDVQQKVFRIAFRGYNERDVDAFLDQVTEELATLHEENKRLRESPGATAGGGVESAQRQAEEIVRQAREHAARLIEDAERAGGAGGSGLPTSFLLGERAFLQRLASSVQEHARWLKQEARRTQAAAPAQEPAQPKRKGKARNETPPPEPAPAPEPEPAPPAPAQEPSSLGAPAAAAGAVAAEQTAAWGPPQEGMAEPSPGWSSPDAPPGESDPLLSAWESAFTDSAAPAPQPAPGGDQEGEPSLRELFWGEE